MNQTSESALGAARTLALTRIVAGIVIALSADVHDAARFAELPAQLVTPPSGIAWLRLLDLTLLQARALTCLVVFTACLGAVGAYTRSAWALTSAGLLVLLALPQRIGAVTHSHHLLWTAALLAVSPSADVWSVDVYFGAPRLGAPRLGARATYTAPLAVLRALVACIYFFPGVHKLVAFSSGTDPAAWLASHLAWKWMQRGHAPSLFGGLSPAWFGPLALAAILFELSMPLWVAFRKTRPWALLGAVLFHLGTTFLLFIRFESLAVLLVSLLDLGPKPATFDRRELAFVPRATWIVGACLLLGAVTTGALGATQLYPFACYPTFAEAAPPTMPSVRVLLVREHERCALARPRGNAAWVAAFRVAGAYGDALSAARAAAYLQTMLGRSTLGACRVRPDTRAMLVRETLAWDFARRRIQVADERVVYSATASALGIAPAGTTIDSSSPTR